ISGHRTRRRIEWHLSAHQCLCLLSAASADKKRADQFDDTTRRLGRGAIVAELSCEQGRRLGELARTKSRKPTWQRKSPRVSATSDGEELPAFFSPRYKERSLCHGNPSSCGPGLSIKRGS